MSDLISREEAVAKIEFGITYAKSLNKETGEVTELFKQSNDELRKAIERIKQLPSAEPVRHGKWIEKSTGGEHFVRCSECGYIEWDAPNNYCPNCGARMDEE